MKYSMNGWRRNLSDQVRELRDIANSIINGEHFDRDDLRETVTELICMSNSINCVYYEGDDLFSDMSDLEVAHLDEIDPDDVDDGTS